MSMQNSRQISDLKVMLVKGSDGNGIVSIEKTGTVGNVDTYTITYTNGNKTTFEVTNGDQANINLAPAEESPSAHAYAVGDHLIYEGGYFVVIQAIQIGDSLIIDTNIERTLVGDEIENCNKTFDLNDGDPVTLSFVGTTATVSDSRVTADTEVYAFFTASTYDDAKAAGIVVDSASGSVVFTADTAPVNSVACTITCRNS